VIEGRLPKLRTLQKVTSVRADRGVQPARARILLEFRDVYRETFGGGQAEPVFVVGNELVAQRGSQTMERLPKGVPGLRFLDVTPKEIDDFVPPDFAADREIAKEGERLSPA